MTSNLLAGRKNKGIIALRLLKDSSKWDLQTKLVCNLRVSKRKRALTFGLTVIREPLRRRGSLSILIEVPSVLIIGGTNSQHMY